MAEGQTETDATDVVDNVTDELTDALDDAGVDSEGMAD